MTKLEELIKELCPNGVEYKAMGELGDFYGGLSGKSKDDFRDGNAKFITYRNVYSNPALNLDIEDRVKIAEGEKQNTLQFGDIIFTGSSETPDECGFSSVITKPTTEKLYLNSFCFFFRLRAPKLLLPDFAKHLFRSENLREQIGRTASGVTRYNVSKDKMKKIVIPLPPLAVQCEIVRILDEYTEQVKILQSKLQEELDARRKQYEYYRDKLLSFDKLSDGGGYELRWFKLKEIAMVKTGTKPVEIFSKGKYEYINAGTGNSGYVNSYNMLGDVVTTPSRGQGGIGYVGYHRNAFWLGPLCYSIQSQDSTIVSNKFLYYILVKQRNDILVAKKEGGIPALNAKDLLAIKLPVPPLGVQEKIVETLDKFDKLCNDLSEGLPAEIEARQKQYEYYRDKLLTFQTE